MKRWTIVCTVLAVLCCAAGSWAATGMTVKATKGFDTTLQISTDNVAINKTEVAGRNVVTVSLPNTTPSFDKGAPELPRLTALVMVDPRRDPIFKVVKGTMQVINLDAAVIPSRGNFTRDIDPANVPYTFGEVYNQDAWYPSDSEMVKMGRPFVFRDVRGVTLDVTPVQYNPAKNQLRVYRNLSIAVSTTNTSTNPVSFKGISKTWEPIYARAFINFRQTSSRLPRLEENGRLLIICADEFVDAIMPFIVWKQKCGIEVKLAKMSEVGATNTDVKAYIQKEYDLGKLTNIMLVGDAEQIPTNKGVKEMADSDPCYTKLAGDDHVPDAIISRLSANTKEEVAYQVAKFVNYEAYPTTNNVAWYTNAMGVASNEGNPTDWQCMEKNNAALTAAMFKNFIKVYDPSATKQMVADGINGGVSLINYLGHGSGTSWGTTRWSNSDIVTLNNGWMLPVIFDVACLNGKFVKFTGFGETWLRAGNIEKPAGAVAYAGSTTNMEWVPPIKVQDEFNQNYIANQVYKTVGGIFINGIMKGLELYTTDPKKSGVMMYEQWHLYGDGTLNVRFKAPVAITAEVAATKEGDTAAVKVQVKDAEGKPVANARVVAYTERVENMTVRTTDQDGNATIALKAGAAGEGYITVTGTDLVPVIDQKVTF